MKALSLAFAVAALLSGPPRVLAQQTVVADICVHRPHLVPEPACPPNLQCVGSDVVTSTTYLHNTTKTLVDYSTVNHTLTVTKTDLKVQIITIPGGNVGFCESTTTTTDRTRTSTITVWKPSTVTQHSYTYVTTTSTSRIPWESVRQSECVRDIPSKGPSGRPWLTTTAEVEASRPTAETDREDPDHDEI